MATVVITIIDSDDGPMAYINASPEFPDHTTDASGAQLYGLEIWDKLKESTEDSGNDEYQE